MQTQDSQQCNEPCNIQASSLAVVIPAYNVAKYIRGTLASIMMNKCVAQIIVVDDCSTDATVDLVMRLARIDPRIEVLQLKKNSGAGFARNKGAEKIKAPYCAFIDADDFMFENALDDAAGLLASRGGDFLLYKWLPADMFGVIQDRNMPPHEEKLWSDALQGQSVRKTDARTAPSILRILNYPWNKIYHTDFFKEKNIRYSTTFVHNDNLAHWLTFVQASSFLLYDKYLIAHKQDFRRIQVSTIMDRRRFQVFEAFDDVDAFFAANPEHADLYPHFCWYKRDLYRGISVHLPEAIIPEYAEKTAASLGNIDSTLFFKICALDPFAAKDIYDMRFDAAGYFTRLRHMVLRAAN